MTTRRNRKSIDDARQASNLDFGGSGRLRADAGRPSFEAASIKRSRTMRNSRSGIQTPPGRPRVDNTPFLDLIEECYDLKGVQVRGGAARGGR